MTRSGLYIVVLALAGCGSKAPVQLITHQAAQLRWPPGPSPARVRYLGQIRGTAEQGGVAEILAGAADPQLLKRPYAVTLAPGDRLVVTDPGAGQVHIFDLRRRVQRVIATYRGQDLATPVGVDADEEGNIYVADSTARKVYIFSPEGDARWSFGGTMQRPAGLAVDRKRGVLYVADTTGHRIHARALNGRYLFGFGERGNGPAQFNYPSHLFFDQRRSSLLVCDTLNFRVQVLDRFGKFKAAIGRLGDSTGSMARPKGVAADSAGHIYVVDALFNAIQVFNLSGELLLYFGRDGRGRGHLALPMGLHVDGRDRIFVANTLNRRVELFQYIKQDKEPVQR